MAHRNRHIRSGSERLAHWLLAISVIAMILSGIEIYRAAPLYGFDFPGWPSLGADLAHALLWHFSAAWGLLLAFVVLLIRRVRRRGVALWPVSVRQLWADLRRLQLPHDDLAYNPVQKLAYLGVFGLLSTAMFSGLVLWKPVQFQMLASLLGGYEFARRIHFWAMAGLALFTLGHVVMALIVPRTIAAMLLGFRKETSDADT